MYRCECGEELGFLRFGCDSQKDGVAFKGRCDLAACQLGTMDGRIGLVETYLVVV